MTTRVRTNTKLRRWTVQPPSASILVDRTYPLNYRMQRCFSAIHGGFDPVTRRNWDTIVSLGSRGANASGIYQKNASNANYVSSLQSTPTAGWSIGVVYVAISGTTSADRAGFCELPGSGTFDRGFMTNGGVGTAYKAQLFDGATKLSGGIGTATANNVVVLVARCTRAFSLQLCLNGQFDTAQACGNNGFTYTTPEFCVGNASNASVASEGFHLVCYWDRDLTNAECISFTSNPWQVFETQVRVIKQATSGVTSFTGGGSDTLQPLTESATGIVGVVSRSGTETLQPLTEKATGITGVVSRSGTETLQPLQTKATGIAGALGFATDTLRPLQSSGGGSVTSNNVIGGGSETLQPLQERATGIIGVIAGAVETLRPLQSKATGIVGVVGFAADALQPLKTQATGINSNPLAPPAPTAGGAPAWWGYEGFDGTRRPWWYKDLKDKVKELERLKQARIEIGLLPPDELIEEVSEFVEEIPTPALADYYIAKYEALTERINNYVEQIEEDADEQDIMRLSKFFFHREERSPWLIQ